ncbi:LysR family transcriptional regulator [Pseudonocardia sp. GCM10023141]|uniref:LysR family transcriptional regulator n=1 Tax=Pseudonocardia sp. GCM10023141 TaxID=3252653 RepID=UPI0036204804
MNVTRLRVLRELADRGSVTAVAAALSFTPSAISQQLKALAEEVGLPLTEPAGRGLRLTEAGRALAAEAEGVLTAIARADAAVEHLRTTPSGPVRMAIFQSGARMMLAGLLARLDAVPEVDLQCRDVDMISSDIPALTAEFDIVIAHRDEQAPPYDARGRVVVPLMREPLDIALPPGHRLTRLRPLHLADLVGEPWISVNVGWPVDDVLRSLAVQTGVAPRVVQRINDFAVTEELVAAGRGLALLPRYSTDFRRGRKIVRRTLAGVRAARLVEAVLRTSAAERPAVATVLAAVQAEAAEIVRTR